MNNQYYTYAFLREDGTPYYIGKGKGRRAFVLSDRKIPPPRDKSRVLFLKRNLTEEEAIKHEKYMIAVLGRKDKGTGILRNMTDGGDGISGFVFPEESKEKLRAAALNRPPVSGEERKRRSERAAGEKNSRFGVEVTEETKDKIGKALKGRKWFRSPDDTQESLCFEGKQPEGWIVGRKTSFADSIWETRKARGTDKWGKTQQAKLNQNRNG